MIANLSTVFTALALLLINLASAIGADDPALERLDHGCTVILPGIDGRGWASNGLARGLAEGGVETAIEVHDWTSGIPLLLPIHMYDKRNNKEQAAALAEKIVEYQTRYPGRPVHLIGMSGGCGILLWTLEALPHSNHVTVAVMLSAAISPTYDVGEALNHTEVGIYNFYSPLDVILLAGTTIGGNIDRRWTPGAGAVGLTGPRDANKDGHPRLVQIAFNPKMAMSGNLGGHWGPFKRKFARDYIAPILKSTETARPLAPVIDRRRLGSDYQQASTMALSTAWFNATTWPNGNSSGQVEIVQIACVREGEAPAEPNALLRLGREPRPPRNDKS